MSGKTRPSQRTKVLLRVDYSNLSYTEKQFIHSMFNLVNAQESELEAYSHNVRAMTNNIREYQKALEEANADIKKLMKDKYRLLKAYRQLEDYFIIAKSKAIKEFADRLKEHLKGNGGLYCVTTMNAQIDNLVKEMVGEENDT
jgi:hypothetical protein